MTRIFNHKEYLKSMVNIILNGEILKAIPSFKNHTKCLLPPALLNIILTLGSVIREWVKKREHIR